MTPIGEPWSKINNHQKKRKLWYKKCFWGVSYTIFSKNALPLHNVRAHDRTHANLNRIDNIEYIPCLRMKKIVTFVGLLATFFAMVATTSCSTEPSATYLEFSYASFSTDEGADKDNISVYLMKSPYKFPVVVDMEVEMLSGENSNGEELVLDDVLTFITTDETYTVEKTDNPRKMLIKGVEVTYTNYNKKIYFTSLPNDYLQDETITIEFRLTKVDGSEMGSIKTTTLTIVDDEKAPLVKVGYYDTRYEAPSDATREGKGQFYMRLQKVGKKEYVASGLFGLPRPRLLGMYNPENNTITFDGTDYDHRLWAEKTAKDDKPFIPVNAFHNDTIWANAYTSGNDIIKITEVLKLKGAGATGTEPIVMTTEEIAENANGVILSIDTPCRFDIYTYDNDRINLIPIGTYDAIVEQSESMTFSTTNYQSVGTRSMGGNHPIPFSAWSVEE